MTLSVTIFYETNGALEKFHEDMVSTWKTQDVTVVKIKPRPFLTIDFSKKDKGLNTNIFEKRASVINLTHYARFCLKQSLKKLRNNFTRDIFCYYNDKLRINEKVANEVEVVCRLPGNKAIKLSPCIVETIENDRPYEHEGIKFSLNTNENFCLLTLSEMDFLIDRLEKIDMDLIGLDLLKYIPKEDLSSDSGFTTERVEDDNLPPMITVTKTNTIPNI